MVQWRQLSEVRHKRLGVRCKPQTPPWAVVVGTLAVGRSSALTERVVVVTAV